MKKFLALLLSLVMVLALVACGAFIKLDVIWVLADIVNGLMAIPNLIALLGLTGGVHTRPYRHHLGINPFLCHDGDKYVFPKRRFVLLDEKGPVLPGIHG